jgi:hypothetical protein
MRTHGFAFPFEGNSGQPRAQRRAHRRDDGCRGAAQGVQHMVMLLHVVSFPSMVVDRVSILRIAALHCRKDDMGTLCGSCRNAAILKSTRREHEITQWRYQDKSCWRMAFLVIAPIRTGSAKSGIVHILIQ